MSRRAARFLVDGHVQGVWFRASTQREAERLAVVGHARNLDDGRVEVMAAGSAEALDALEEWLQLGPERARVAAVVRQQIDTDLLSDSNDFIIA